MKGIVGAQVVKSGGVYVIRIECRDEETYKRVIRKLRLIGIYISTEKI